MSELIIETKGLTKVFNKFIAVKDVSLKVPKGTLYGFLGPNGAGKSTTIRMLLGLIKPTKGMIYLFNKDIKNHRMEILRKVGAMVESSSYYGNLMAFCQILKGEFLKQRINFTWPIVFLAPILAGGLSFLNLFIRYDYLMGLEANDGLSSWNLLLLQHHFIWFFLLSLVVTILASTCSYYFYFIRPYYK